MFFAKWRLHHDDGEVVVEDGVIDPLRWKKMDRKVLFLLKEPGDNIRRHCGEDSMIVLFMQMWKGARYSFRSLGRWAYGLQQAAQEGYPSYEVADNKNTCDEAF